MNARQRERLPSPRPAPHSAPVHAGPTLAARPAAPGFDHGFDWARLPLPAEPARGPFAPEVNAVLETAFGATVEGVSVTRGADALNRAVGAKASTVGSRVFLGSDVAESLDDPGSFEVIAHEVAHALAPGSAPRSLLDRPGDPGERVAAEAGRAVRGGLERGGIEPGSAQPAAGGGAALHRFESGEHRRAVDEAIENLGEEREVDPAVAAQMEARIKLANGLEVSPGQITALMGDFYGRFDEEGHFDPKASFNQLNTANPEEMGALLGAIAREEKGEHVEASEWESITRNRRGDGETGEGDLSYLELAQRNSSHFSAPTAEGTDNNLGAYSAFHQMALEAAAKGDENTARALEASSMHYLTDRHAGGHNFDKNAVMEASGFDPGGVLANMAVKTVHDDLNANGTTVADASGNEWRAYGDGHWDAFEDESGNLIDPNAENRRRTAESVYGSYSELSQVASGARSATDVEAGGYGALETVPQWDTQRQEGAEAVARNTTVPEILSNYGGDLPDALSGKAWRALGQAENWASDKVDEVSALPGRALDWGARKLDELGPAVAPFLPPLPDLPSLPELPEMPDFPTLPDIPLPSLPDIPLPSLPELPSFSLPELPSLPEIPLPSLPELPSLSELWP